MFDIFFSSTPAFLISAFVFSLCIGSFLNVVIYRLPIMMRHQVEDDYFALNNPEEGAPKRDIFNLSIPVSACPNCKSKIKPWQNIPVISYLWLKGKCANCKTPISKRYPAIELITGLLGLVVAFHFGPTLQCLVALGFTYCLVALTLIDFDHYLLPDSITLPLVWLGLLANSFSIFIDLTSAVYGAIAGYLILWSIYWLFKLLTGKEGMGYGDFKLLAAIGALLGWQALPVVILLSSAVGAVVGISLIIVLGRDKNIPIPFGPYLAAAGFIAMLWGDELLQTYLQISGIK